ncbi:MAG: NAD(P)-binding domain-containing protein [Pyrinomonadaceae bacterium]
MRETNLLIIGAGPFGLALAAQAAHDGIAHLIVGKPMEFWRRNMPQGMYLRSACDWHLDPLNLHTIEAFLQTQGKSTTDVEPLSLDFYLSYAEWFQQQKKLRPLPVYIRRLNHDAKSKHFVAITEGGQTIGAKKVVLAPGFKHFRHVPDDLKRWLPPGRFQHTAEFVSFSTAPHRRYLIIGGRQSAFEWAALLIESGATAVHLSHRHPSPAFAVADWSWVNPLVEGMVQNPSWFRCLPDDEKKEIVERMWGEGRLKVEPWLEPRLNDERVRIWPQTEVINCQEKDNGELVVELSNGETVQCDQIVLATGYKVDIAKLPFLSSGNILGQLRTLDGFPVLDDHFETSVPGLFITSLPATQDFGPFFGFTISVRASARLICERLMRKDSLR